MNGRQCFIEEDTRERGWIDVCERGDKRQYKGLDRLDSKHTCLMGNIFGTLQLKRVGKENIALVEK